MSSGAQFLTLLALDLGGLVLLYFLLRARIRRQLELENLLSGVREEARALVMDLNETADRNVSLVEDRIVALRGLLDELDRRMGVARREIESRDREREAFDRLRRRRPILSGAAEPAPLDLGPAAPPRAGGPEGSAPELGAPIPLELGSAQPPPPEAAIPILRRPSLDIRIAPEPILPAKTRREEALELSRKGFSPDLIAARLGAPVSEIELLVDMEQRRSAAAR